MRELTADNALVFESTGNFGMATLCSHVGLARTENQDRVGHAVGKTTDIFVVADGVGGQSGGAEAAALAVDSYKGLVGGGAEGKHLAEAALQSATEDIHHRIQVIRETQPEFGAMAAAVAVVYLQGDTATIGHLGDTRVYLFRDGQLQRLTRDHSVVERMVEEGLLTEAEARVHPKGHVLTRSIGQAGVPLDTQQIAIRTGDLLLMCSDGLWTCVPENRLTAELARTGADTSAAVDRLLELTLKAGAPDNVSLALLFVAAASNRSAGLQSEDMLSTDRPRSALTSTGLTKRNVRIGIGVLLTAVALVILYCQLR